MFNATLIVIEAFIRELQTTYERTYSTMEPGYPGVIGFVAQLALENIATTGFTSSSHYYVMTSDTCVESVELMGMGPMLPT
jgi:hypothetical protein